MTSANPAIRNARATQVAFLAVEVAFEGLDPFLRQVRQALVVDHRVHAATFDPGRRKGALGITKRQPGALRAQQAFFALGIVLQLTIDLLVQRVELGVGLFVLRGRARIQRTLVAGIGAVIGLDASGGQQRQEA